jgi:hypothetical protein
MLSYQQKNSRKYKSGFVVFNHSQSRGRILRINDLIFHRRTAELKIVVFKPPSHTKYFFEATKYLNYCCHADHVNIKKQAIISSRKITIVNDA